MNRLMRRRPATRRSALRFAVVGTLAVSAVAGCAAVNQERHFFKSVDPVMHTTNYYRVTVDGSTFLSSSRYFAGYYDEETIDAYFNTISQPKDGTLRVATDGVTPIARTEPGESVVQPLENAATPRKLVLLLSSNSDAIAEGLSALARSNEVATSLTNIVGARRFESAAAAATVADAGAIRGSVTLDEINRVLANVVEGAQPQTRDQMLMLANDLATLIAPHDPFDSLDKAAAWLSAHATEGMQ